MAHRRFWLAPRREDGEIRVPRPAHRLADFPMGKVEFNPTISRIRGKVGGFIYRKQHGQTVVVPYYPGEVQRKPSAAQRAGRARFKDAQAYAARVMSDPLKRECYRQLAAARKTPPNALLIANFLNPPVVAQVDLGEYQGAAGSIVRVLATDPIEVVSVGVTARGIDGRVVEAGAAAKDHDVWVYRCTTALAGVATKLEITAENRAGAKGGTTVAL